MTLGMSYHGFKIFYELVNAVPQWAAERAFTPWPDMETQMRAEGLPLYSLETRRPLGEFDIIDFTLQHEINYTNILNMLDLARLPLESSERPSPLPLIMVAARMCTLVTRLIAPPPRNCQWFLSQTWTLTTSK
mgnify:CR=1 FL=1